MSSKYPKKLEEVSCRWSSGVLLLEHRGGGMGIGHRNHYIEGKQQVSGIFFLELVSERKFYKIMA